MAIFIDFWPFLGYFFNWGGCICVRQKGGIFSWEGRQGIPWVRASHATLFGGIKVSRKIKGPLKIDKINKN